MAEEEPDPHAQMSRKGGKARARKMTAKERSEAARKAARARWGYKTSEADLPDDSGPLSEELEDITPMESPFAKHRGTLKLGNAPVDCYVLDTGERVISLRATVSALADVDSGNLGRYIGVAALKPYLDQDNVLGQIVQFNIPGTQKSGHGLSSRQFLRICKAYVSALGEGALSTPRQQQIAIRCASLLSACADIGLEALIDEATGYQYIRAEDALQIKLRAYVAEELRGWEKTFPDELWEQFGRLTGWKAPLHKRPRWWGRLVMELIYDALDKDVADHLRNNKPPPRKGQNYHQWLTSDIGLRALNAQIHQVIGIAKTCRSMSELRDEVARHYGKEPVQLRLYLPRPKI